MKRILITGAAGFIGRHFTRYVLENTDWSVVMLDRLGEGSDMTAFANWLHETPGAIGRTKAYWHNLRAAVHGGLGTYFDYIVHLAAGSHVDRSIRDPLGFVADNVTGTAHMLEFARRCEGLEKFLHFSTDEVFGAASAGKAFDEYDSFHPTNPYAASKAAAEALCPAWANTYGLPIVVTRCTNVVGPGQDSEKFIPSTIGKVASGHTVQIHSRNGISSSRKYIDVADVCAATLRVLTHGGVISGRGSGYYNIAGDTDWPNDEVAELISVLLEKELFMELVQDPPNRPRPDQRYDLNNARLKALGWAQQVGLEESLRKVIECDSA